MLTLRRDYANALHTPPAVYAEPLRLGRVSADGKLVFDAQRHLGDHRHDPGDHEAALAAWEGSAQAAARAGHITGVLAQRNLLAALARRRDRRRAQPCWPRRPDAGQRPSGPPVWRPRPQRSSSRFSRTAVGAWDRLLGAAQSRALNVAGCSSGRRPQPGRPSHRRGPARVMNHHSLNL